jgi:type IV pilus assembly protein PilM
MNFRLLRRERAVGLDVGSGSIRALVLERRRGAVVAVGCGAASVEAAADAREYSQAIHSALAHAGADGEPVVAAVGGPEVVIRQVSLPPVPPAKILPALEIQHRDLGLLPPGDAVTDAQVLRKSGDGSANEILSVSVPKSRIEERLRLLRQAAVDVQVLDVEPLALLNAAIRLTELENGELLVLLTVGHQTSVLCLWSEQGPVVARYLNIGAAAFAEPLRLGLGRPDASTRELARMVSPQDIAKAEEACRELVERIADDVRLSLTFYRTEYDRESLPRYGIAGSLDVPYLGRWVADRLGLGGPPELLDPFKAVDVLAAPTGDELLESGPEFLQAFGLALRGV